MVQTQTVCGTTLAVRPQRTRNSKNKNPVNAKGKVVPKNPLISICPNILPKKRDDGQVANKDRLAKEESEGKRKEKTLAEYLSEKKQKERQMKEKKAEEEREQFLKEAAERKAAEREEIIKRAKKLIFYRKPMCARLNRGLLLSECLRELDAHIKFRETLKNVDREQELAYVNLMRADVAKYQEETKQKTAKQMETRRIYGDDLRKQIEETRATAMSKAAEEFEADRQDQINMKKKLEIMQEYETRRLTNKKMELKQFFEDAIEEKKRYDMQLKLEEQFEDRANQVFKNSKARIEKMQKSLEQKEREEREERARLIALRAAEGHIERMKIKADSGEKSYQKAVNEKEELYRENQRAEKEREDRMRKQMHDYHAMDKVAKLKQLQEENDMRDWERLQVFKKIECNQKWEAEERKRVWNEKMEYAKTLKNIMSENETRRNTKYIEEDHREEENQRILDYAEELLKESTGVRPLYPLLKAVEECKKEMGMLVPKKTCQAVPEENLLYL